MAHDAQTPKRNPCGNLYGRLPVRSYREMFFAYARARWRPERCAAKLLARTAFSPTNTARTWLQERSAADTEAMLWLMARDPAFKALILDLVAKREAADARPCRKAA